MYKYLLFSLTFLASAQRVFTAADYQHAEKFMTYNTNSLVFQNSVRPTWLPNDHFWYRNTVADGAEFILVDPARGTRQPAFDHAKLAVTLSKAADVVYGPHALPFQEIEFSPDGQFIHFNAASKKWKCDVGGAECISEGAATGGGRGRGGRGGGFGPARNDAQSPDKQHTAFIRNYNLWMRDAG